MPVTIYGPSPGTPGPPGQDGTPGAPGAAGVPGASGGSITIEVATPSSTWLLPHNLGYKPHWDFEDSAHMPQEGVVTHIDNNNSQAEFKAPFAGWANAS